MSVLSGVPTACTDLLDKENVRSHLLETSCADPGEDMATVKSNFTYMGVKFYPDSCPYSRHLFRCHTQEPAGETRFSTDETIAEFGSRWDKPAKGIKLPTYKQISSDAEKFLKCLKKKRGSNKAMTFQQIREVHCGMHLIKAAVKLSKDQKEINLFQSYSDIMTKTDNRQTERFDWNS